MKPRCDRIERTCVAESAANVVVRMGGWRVRLQAGELSPLLDA
jgi:hypothetical protein